MKRNFVEVQRFLEHEFPALRYHIDGSEYPAPPIVDQLAAILSWFQLLAMAWFFLGGERLVRGVGLVRNNAPLPNWFRFVQENSSTFGFVLFLIIPQVINQYRVSGAFEIYLDGNEVFSKLALKRFPTAPELFDLMSKAGLQHASKTTAAAAAASATGATANFD